MQKVHKTLFYSGVLNFGGPVSKLVNQSWSLPIHGVHTSDELPAFSLELFNHFFHWLCALSNSRVFKGFSSLAKKDVNPGLSTRVRFSVRSPSCEFSQWDTPIGWILLYNVPRTYKIQALQHDGIVQSASDKQTFGKKVNGNGIFFREIHSIYFERIIIYYIVILKHFLYFVSVSSKRF